MKYVSSSETFMPVDEAVQAVRNKVEPLLVQKLTEVCPANPDLLLRYVPIVMPEKMAERYPARSKARMNHNELDCAPQLDYQTFLKGTFEQKVSAYLDGLRTITPLLAKFSFEPDERERFENALVKVARMAQCDSA